MLLVPNNDCNFPEMEVLCAYEDCQKNTRGDAGPKSMKGLIKSRMLTISTGIRDLHGIPFHDYYHDQQCAEAEQVRRLAGGEIHQPYQEPVAPFAHEMFRQEEGV